MPVCKRLVVVLVWLHANFIITVGKFVSTWNTKSETKFRLPLKW